MSFSFQVLGVGAANAQLASLGPKIDAALVVGVGRGVQRGQSIVRGKVSGRPGPRNVTGDFRRSIQSDFAATGFGAQGQIGTVAAQALRLEFGFVGVDSLGRRYNQPPYSYMGPAVPEVERAVVDEIVSAVKGAL